MNQVVPQERIRNTPRRRRRKRRIQKERGEEGGKKKEKEGKEGEGTWWYQGFCSNLIPKAHVSKFNFCLRPSWLRANVLTRPSQLMRNPQKMREPAGQKTFKIRTKQGRSTYCHSHEVTYGLIRTSRNQQHEPGDLTNAAGHR